jgi:hypothetical protein
MQSGKGGVETTNGISGIIKDESGNPVAQAQVILIPDAYDAFERIKTRSPEKTETDAEGRYRFDQVTPGAYTVESNLPVKNLKAWYPSLNMGQNGLQVMMPALTLKPTGVLQIPFSDRHLAENTVLYIPGTTFSLSIVGKINSRGALIVPGLPEGRFPGLLAYFPDTSDGINLPVCPAFTIQSGDTTFLPALSSWRGKKILQLDFSSAGGLVEPLAGHPILVRLDSGNFNFSEAASDGRDLRFTDPSGVSLAFLIEQWDSVLKAATIWVNYESLILERDSLIMHWGRKDAIEISNGAKVFDSVQGFARVWHLGQVADSGFQAIAGSGKLFQGKGDGISGSMPPALSGDKSFSVTFWMTYQSNPLRQTILSMGEEFPNHGFHFLIRPDKMAQFGPFDSAGSGDPSLKQNSFDLSSYLNRWIFVATVYDAANGKLTTYINGVATAISALKNLDMRASAGLRIGTAISDSIQTQSDFNGGLDEVRLYDKAISQESVRLEYLIQRVGSEIVIKP